MSSKLLDDWLKNNDFASRIRKATSAYTSPHMAFMRFKLADTQKPWNVLIRGVAVGALIILIDEQTGEKFALFVEQDRFATGRRNFGEIVAGMLKSGEIPELAMSREIKEETSLDIDPGQLIRITIDSAPFLSPGISNEQVVLFYTEQYLPKEKILALDNTWHGLELENERTRVRVLPLSQLESSINWDTKSFLAYLLYSRIP